jgi:UDP-3-O-[3-hydroxymyristoyl] N-acetylglucosamine deacetylase
VIYQRTLKHSVNATGIGMHSGKKVMLTMKPAPVDTGIVFRRTDLSPSVEIPAKASLVGDTVLSTTVECNGVKVSTVEHIMSALFGLGVDNAYIEVDNVEIPIMDGSAAPFVFLVQSVGIATQDKLKSFIRIKKEIMVTEGDKYAKLLPYDGFKMSFSIDFDHPVFLPEHSHYEFDFSKNSYIKDFSRARTFGFLHEIEYLRSQGLALGGTTDNAIVIDEYRVLNESGLRYEQEMVIHKILDALGDIYLQGSFIGEVQAYKSGHALNNKLMRELIRQPDAWEEVVFDSGEVANDFIPQFNYVT